MPSTTQNTTMFSSLGDVVRYAVTIRDQCREQNERHFHELQDLRRDWQEFNRVYNERKNQTRMMQQQHGTRNYGTAGVRPGTNARTALHEQQHHHHHHHPQEDDSSSGRTGYYSPPSIRNDGCNIHITLPHVPATGLSPPKYSSTPNPPVGGGAPPRHPRNTNNNKNANYAPPPPMSTNLCTPSPRHRTLQRPAAPASGPTTLPVPDHSSEVTSHGFQEAKCPRCGARLGIIFDIYHLNNNCS